MAYSRGWKRNWQRGFAVAEIDLPRGAEYSGLRRGDVFLNPLSVGASLKVALGGIFYPMLRKWG
jgi:hypothetical protein